MNALSLHCFYSYGGSINDFVIILMKLCTNFKILFVITDDKLCLTCSILSYFISKKYYYTCQLCQKKKILCIVSVGKNEDFAIIPFPSHTHTHKESKKTLQILMQHLHSFHEFFSSPSNMLEHPKNKMFQNTLF